MTPQQHDFLDRAFQAAKAANHVEPEMAACEAALESGWGRSWLAVNDRNLFGCKQHQHPIYGTVALPTKEYLKGEWETVTANFVNYPDWQSCFKDRMDTLTRLAAIVKPDGTPEYPHYRNALTAGASTTYITEVSRTWSTDPNRAEKVLAIYNAVAGDWNAT
jgi:flagellum-specific peptidoglycan hydrolase FlgJ